jgi:small subunit ribosomal protein S6
VPDRPAYDLFVLIDADAPEERREQILEAIKKQIDSGDGELKADVDWGVRKLAFEIAHRGDAYYHLFQLEARPELLNQLEHSLAIDDAVLRHRIIRLSKGVPASPPRPSPSTPRPAPVVDEHAVAEETGFQEEAGVPEQVPESSENSEAPSQPESQPSG